VRRLNQILNCRKNFRCHAPLSCKTCGETWQKAKFKGFCSSFKFSNKDSITFLVIKPDYLNSLTVGVSLMFGFINELRDLKKRGKICDFYSRLEVSFGKQYLGFNPHLNIVCFGDTKSIEEAVKTHGLGIYKRKKENDINVVKSLLWYILKYNPLGVEKGEAVRKAFDKKSSVLHSKRFNSKSYIDEIIDIDFSFMGVYPIRTKEELIFRAKIKDERAKINKKFKKFLSNHHF